MPAPVNAEELLPVRKRESLTAWFGLYVRIEVEGDTNTFQAKRRDLESFLNFFLKMTGADEPDQWTSSITKGFQSHLHKEGRKATTINRTIATLRHCASWLHRQRSFLAGPPCQVKDIQVDEPSWKGLRDENVTRLRSASEQLMKIRTAKYHTPVRDHAIFLVLLRTGLRVSELLDLDIGQYQGKHLVNVKRKGKKVTAKVFLPKEAKEALDRYLDKVWGRGDGPLFIARGKNAKPLIRQAVSDLLNLIAAQANARLPESQKIHLTPHVLRHTMLRKVATEYGVQSAMEVAGHTSPNYIWRYVKATDEEKERSLEQLFEEGCP